MQVAPHNTHRRRVRRRMRVTRRGVVGVLAMMFLVMFASLATAMAVATQGNLRSAASHLRVVRALGSVDTGMRLAESRLREASERFLVAEGDVTPEYIATLWSGPIPGTPRVEVLPAPFGMDEDSEPGSVLAALSNIHAADEADNLVMDSDVENAPAPIILLDRGEDWLVTRPIGIARNAQGLIVSAAQISYGPPDDEGDVPVIVTGYDWDAVRGRWVTRTAEMWFTVSKRIEFAIISNNPPLLGVGGNVDGPIGSLFDSSALDDLDGPPIVTTSDFYGLSPELDEKLDDFYASVLTYDVDGDNRLRGTHISEADGLGLLNQEDYDDDGDPDIAFSDATRDDAVDDYDIFLNHFDANNDGRVVLSTTLTLGTPAAGQTAEFTVNDRLAYLIDTVEPDRNRNGWRNGDHEGSWDYDTFEDNNNDGLLDGNDIDDDDVVLGYRDGVLDYRDRYAKVRGSIYMRASRSDWESASDSDGSAVGDYQQYVQGPIRPDDGDAPVTFDADSDEVPTISADGFVEATSDLTTAQLLTSPATFEEQVAEQMGDGWTPPTRVEATPFGARSAADWYQRPVYQDMTFVNVTIPMGNNGLFINCEFIGITRVQTYVDNTHLSWIFYGEQQRDPVTNALEQVYPPPPASSEIALDTSYSTPGAPGYDALPLPLDVSYDLDGDGAIPDRCYDTKQLSNNIRFHDCLFVGSIVADKPLVYTHVRNKLQFTGATRFTDAHPEEPDNPEKNPDPDTLDEIERSSLMVPHYSVDIGSLNPPPEQDVNLSGAVVAGVLDVRGNATIRGVLLSTFQPIWGEPPLSLYGEPVGNPANFNMTIGYVTADQGDLEGLDPSSMSDLDGNGTLDIGWDSARDETGALIDVTGWDGAHDELWYDGVPDEDAVPGTHVRRAVEFNGFGITRVEADPNAVLPDGLELPLRITPVAGSYRERHQ
jgi:hypothetical protein